MKFSIYTILFSLTLTSYSCQESRSQEDQKPNIILILTDDQGYGDIGRHGNPHIKTPYLDQLHDESVRFTNFHVATTCAPTRAGLLSGIHCNRAGAWHTIKGRSFLNKKFSTIADHLSEEGYATGIFGKWHLGDNYPYRPQDRGFDEVLIHGGGGVGQTPDFWNNDYFDDTYFHNGVPTEYEGFCTDVWFEEAIKFMKTTEERPFFTYITTNAPHSPHHAPQEYIDPYVGNEEIPNANFYGQISNIDDNIGRLEQYLSDAGIKDNTILIFTTDNGTASGAKLDKDQFVTAGFNSGMRGKKVSEYDGGHRVPLFIRFPESMNVPLKTYDQLTTYTDIMPTILDVVNVDLQPGYMLDGISIKPLLMNGAQQELTERIVIVDTQREDTLIKHKNYSVMKNNWRLVNGSSLYDVAKDSEQRNSVAADYPQVVSELSAAYEKWWDAFQDDAHDYHYIPIGTSEDNPVLLTAHDWHSTGLPPWHQRHIRSARPDNGYWDIEVTQSATYKVRLYRWPPNQELALDATVPEGDEVEGGKPFLPGEQIEITSAKLQIQNIDLVTTSSTDNKFYEFEVELDRGKSKMWTSFENESQIELGAFYVEIELED